MQEGQPLALTARQESIWRRLSEAQTDKHRLADWYLGALYALANPHNPDRCAQAAQSLRELFEKIPLVLTGDTMPKSRKRDRVGRTFAATDPMWVTLPVDVQTSNVDQLFAIYKTLEDLAHHGSTASSIEELLAEVDGTLERLLAPITADNQTEIEAILGKGSDVTEREIQRTLSLIRGSGANFTFFFKTCAHPIWLRPLRDAGLLRKAPDIRKTEIGLTFPFWWPGIYLLKVAGEATDEVVEVLRDLEKTDNPQVFDKIVKIAANLPDPTKALPLEPLVSSYLAQDFHFGTDAIDKLLIRWAETAGRLLPPAVRLVKQLVSFRADPQRDEKFERHKSDPSGWTTSLEPLPKFEDYEYQQLLESGVRAVVRASPLDATKVLIDAVAGMLDLATFGEERPSDQWIDSSEIWANRVDDPRHPYRSAKTTLVATLTFGCEQVYERFGDDRVALAELDHYLRDGRWSVFARIRHHLYARHLPVAKQWVQEAIVQHREYGVRDYSYEFQQMVRLACEQFGSDLLPKAGWSRIFAEILAGPDIEEDRRFYGEKFDEINFHHRRRRLHKRWLRPFRSVLFSQYKEAYDNIASEGPELADDDYTPFAVGESKTGASIGPVSRDQLGAMSDDQLVTHLNQWEDARRDPEHWWIDIDFRGSAGDFRALIEGDPNRFLRWGKRWEKLQRPVYLAAAIEAAGRRLKEANAMEISTWLDVCDWIMHQQDATGSGDRKPSDSSRTSPSWNSARRAVVDLLGLYVAKDSNVSIDFRPRIFALLKRACAAPDLYLDDRDSTDKPRDFLFEAINSTRGRALEHLILYGWWVRRHEGPDASVTEVFPVLESRFQVTPALTKAEHTLLGMQFTNLYVLNGSWAQGNVEAIFPKNRSDVWAAAFGAYLAFTSAYGPLFDVVREQLEFALKHLELLRLKDDIRANSIARLGEHIFSYYVWGKKGAASLLQAFYENTDVKQWALLFDYVGRRLKNTLPQALKPEFSGRCKEFFEIRLAAGVSEELVEFTFWFEAEGLELDWRLNALSRLLDITKGKVRSLDTIVERLSEIVKQNTPKVLECFKKLTRAAGSGSHMYIPDQKVKMILNIGVRSLDPATRQDARDAQENLLRAGLSEYLRLDG